MVDDSKTRRASIPILFTRGTHYEVGYEVGRVFQRNIETFLARNLHLNQVLVEKYESSKVRRGYEAVLKNLEVRYPQYIEELKGVAAGAKVPFFKLFLLHVDDFVSYMCGKEPFGGLLGSTTVCCDEKAKVFLGHSQDFSPDVLNLSYIVSVHIQEPMPCGKWGVAEEKFTAFCLPGMLPGLCMGYNHHGMVFTVNTVSTGKEPSASLTPRHFLCRALLACSNMFEACEVLRDEDAGASDGFSVNMIFARQEGQPLFHNAEVAPPTTKDPTKAGNQTESLLSVLTLSQGETLTHCNKYLRLKEAHSDQLPLWSSNHRHAVLKTLPRVQSISSVVAILGDQTDVMYSFFRDGGGKDEARTIAVGIFNIDRGTWSIYTHNPKVSLPVVTLPMLYK